MAGCSDSIDLALLLGTEGLTDSSWVGVTSLMLDVVRRMDVSRTGVNMGLELYQQSARIWFDFNDYFTSRDIISAIQNVGFERGSTDTPNALRILRQDLYQTSRGDRAGNSDVAVLFISGRTITNELNSQTRLRELREQVRLLRDRGIRTIVVADGNPNTALLNNLLTDVNSDAVFSVRSFSDLRNSARFDDLIREICRRSTTPAPPVGNYAKKQHCCQLHGCHGCLQVASLVHISTPM